VLPQLSLQVILFPALKLEERNGSHEIPPRKMREYSALA